MSDQGSNNEPDLWANTGKQPSAPPPVPPLADDPTMVQPTTPGAPEPTAVQPVTPGPINAPVPPAGVVAGPGMPPDRQPPPPPGGGGPGGPGDPNDPGSERPAWLVPAGIGLAVGLVAAGIIFLLTRDGDDDTVATDGTTTTSIRVETTIATDTTIATETTIAPETTVSPETTIAPDTTVAPTTGAPTTAPPTTAAPTTAPPEGITPAAPGQALVAGTPYDIVSACATSPVTGYQVTSYVVFGDFGPLVIEEAIDEGGEPFGLFSDSGSAIDTEEYEDLGDAGFGMLAFQGDGFFEVAANPGGIDVGGCATQGFARLSDPAAPEFGYTHGIVDMCATNAPFRAIAYLSEGARLQIVDNEDGTADITFDSTDLFSATDPAATISSAGGRQVIDGLVTGSTIDGETTQAINIDVDITSARGCFGAESP